MVDGAWLMNLLVPEGPPHGRTFSPREERRRKFLQSALPSDQSFPQTTTLPSCYLTQSTNKLPLSQLSPSPSWNSSTHAGTASHKHGAPASQLPLMD